MLPNPFSSSSRKGIGIHKDFFRQPHTAAGRHILLSVSYHCSPVLCNIRNCLFLLLNSLSLCSNCIMKNTISGKAVNFSLPFFSTVKEIRAFLLLDLWKMCTWALRVPLTEMKQAELLGSRPLDHNTTTKNHSENHFQILPNKWNSILSNAWDKNSMIVQNTSHPVWALQLL